LASLASLVQNKNWNTRKGARTMSVEKIEQSRHVEDGLEVTLTVYQPSIHFDYDTYLSELLDKIKAFLLKEKEEE
jgi:hypothetical protein